MPKHDAARPNIPFEEILRGAGSRPNKDDAPQHDSPHTPKFTPKDSIKWPENKDELLG
jgi:hypothetical protein